MKFSIRKQKAVQPVTSVSSATREPNRRKVLYAMIASLLVLAIVLGSIALFQRHQDAQADQKRKDAIATAEVSKAKDDQITSLKTQLAAVNSDKTVGCNYIKGLTKIRTVQNFVVVPTGMNCPN